MVRYASGMVQKGLPLSRVREIPIPRLGARFQSAVAGCVSSALATRRLSARDLANAERVVIAAIGLQDWHPAEPLTFCRRAAETRAAQRLDSKYFAPRVAELLVHLGSSGGVLGEVAPPRHEKFAPSADG